MSIIIEHIHQTVSIYIAIFHLLTAVSQRSSKICIRFLSYILFYDFVESKIYKNPLIESRTEADVLRLHVAVGDLEIVQLPQALFEVPFGVVVGDHTRWTKLHAVLDAVRVDQQVEEETVGVAWHHS